MLIGAVAATEAAPAEAKKEEKKEEEEADVDMGGLFGDDYWVRSLKFDYLVQLSIISLYKTLVLF